MDGDHTAQCHACDKRRGSAMRSDDQPGLCMAAEARCSTRLTDGFCTPKTRDCCRCWNDAEALMSATGMSARAAAWVFSHVNAIEREAAKQRGNEPAVHTSPTTGSADA